MKIMKKIMMIAVALLCAITTRAYTITVAEQQNCTVTVSPQQDSYSKGDAITVTITPATGAVFESFEVYYECSETEWWAANSASARRRVPVPRRASSFVYRLELWNLDGYKDEPVEVTKGTTYTFTMPDRNVEIEAIFIAVNATYSITKTATNNGSTLIYVGEEPAGSATDATTATQGTTVNIRTTPNEGYSVDEVKVYERENVGGSIFESLVDVNKIDKLHYSFTMPANPVRVMATYRVTPPTLTLHDDEDNTEMIEKYDGQTVNVEYDRVLSAIDNGDGTWSPRCYTMCLPYDINFYEEAESGQVTIYRLKYIDIDNNQFIFTNDLPYATGGIAWLVVVNHGSVRLDADGVKIIGQPLDSELTWIVDYQDFVDESRDPKVVGYWTGTYRRIYDDEAETLNIYGMYNNGSWNRYRVTSHGAKWSWIGTYRAFFQAKESLGIDTFKPMFTFTGAGEDDETGKVEEFPVINFEGDVANGEASGISPVIRTIEADGSNRYFDLQGRQLDGKPTAKGLYIVNGKKVKM